MRNSGFELQFFQSSNRRRAKTAVMEEISSQNSDLGLEDLDKLKAKGQAENAKSHFVGDQKIRELVRQTKAES